MRSCAHIVVRLAFAMLVCIASVTAQTTTVSPSCVPDPLDPTRNILEITGEPFSSSTIVINSPIDNCHLYIHDLFVSSIKITSPISNNSNITIRNVSSSDKSIATLIWFTNAIVNFSFIDINDIAHSSLYIDLSTTGSHWISIVKFDGPIVGNSDITSWINIAGLEMNDTLCDGTWESSLACSLAMIYFGSTITNVTALKTTNFEMNNVETSSSSSATAYLSCMRFNAGLNLVQEIFVSLFAVRNAKAQNDALGKACDVSLVTFAGSLTAHPGKNTSKFTIRDVLVDDFTANAQTKAALNILLIINAISNYNTILVRNVSLKSLTAISNFDFANIFCFSITSSATGIVGSSSSSLLFENNTAERLSSISVLYAQVSFFYVAGAISNFTNIKVHNLNINALTLTGTYAFSAVYILYFERGIEASSSSSSSSMFEIENAKLENVSLTGRTGSGAYFLVVDKAITGYNDVKFSNIQSISITSTSTSSNSIVVLFQLTSLVASASSPQAPSSVAIENITLANASSTGSTYARVRLFTIVTVDNYRNIRISNLNVMSMNCTASTDFSSLVILRFSTGISAPTSAETSSSFLIENVRLVGASSTSINAEADLFLFYTARNSVVNNCRTVIFTNISTANLVASSSFSTSKIYAVSFGGLANCVLLQVQDLVMKNVAASTVAVASSKISVLSFDSGENIFNNISKILLQQSKLEQISISSNFENVVRIFDSGSSLKAESIFISNNSLLLLTSEDTSSILASQQQELNTSVAVVQFTLGSSRFGKMQVTNNVLRILDPQWQKRCSSSNCSIIRINNNITTVQPGNTTNNNNNNNRSTVSITKCELSSFRSSFISFANFTNSDGNFVNINNPLTDFVLQNNRANFPDANSVSSLLGFDSPPSSLSPFPPLVFIEVKCNQWPRIVHRTYEQQLLSSVSSFSKVHNFIHWTCHSDSSSESTSQFPTSTSSSSNSQTAMSSMSSSHSIVRNSVSPLDSETKSNDIISQSISTSSSVSSDRSRSTSIEKTKTTTPHKNPSPFILKISEAVNSALFASDVTQAVSIVALAAFASIASSPALGFTIGRQQAMMDFAQKSLHGDCRGLIPSTTVKNFEDEVSNPLGLGDSPTQLSIGGTEKLMSYYVGAVIGNCLLVLGLVCLNLGFGRAVAIFLRSRIKWIRKFVKKSNVASMMKERCGGFNTKKEPLMKSLRRVFARSYVSLTLFFCLSFLLTSTLSSALIILVAARNDPKLENQQVPWYLKLLSLVCAIVFSIVAFYFVLWSVMFRRKQTEKYRSFKELGLEPRRTERERTLASWLLKPRGEWRYPAMSNVSNIFSSSNNNNNNNDKKNRKIREAKKYERCYNDFLIAEPAFESYRTSIWFSIVEVATAIALAFPPFFAQFASSPKSSCLIQGIMLLIILLMYTTILIWKNPFKLRILRIMNPILSVQQLVVVAMSIIFAARNNNNNNNEESPSWFWSVVIIPLGFESLMSLMMIGAAVFPILMFFNKLRGRAQRNPDGNN